MLTKKQTEKYADILVWGIKECRRRKFKKGDIAQIKYDPLGVNLAKEVYKRLLNAGLHIVLDVTIPIDVEKYYYDNATNSQLDFLGPWRHQLYKNLNGNIYICAPESLTYLKDCDPKKISRSSLATKPLRKITEKRENKRLFGWTLCVYPTQALADESGMTLKQYTNQIIRACYLNEEEPVTKWEEIYREMKRIIKWLNRLTKNTSYFHVESKRMDLKIDPGDERRWQSGNGANIPSFELFISPNWRGTRGVHFANQPSYRSGNIVRDVRLEFRKGRVIKATARENEKYLISQLDTDEGARQVGEFSLTDKRFSKINKFMADILFDENIGGKYGNCHIAIGDSYTETFAGDISKLTKNIKKKLGFNDSAIHWDLINTEDKVVTAYFWNGRKKVIYEKGEFQY